MPLQVIGAGLAEREPPATALIFRLARATTWTRPSGVLSMTPFGVDSTGETAAWNELFDGYKATRLARCRLLS